MAKWGHDLCDLGLWPWPFAWSSRLSMVTTPEYFRMIRWQEHCQKGVTDGCTDGHTDRRTEISVLRAAWSQLKIEWLGLLTDKQSLCTTGSLTSTGLTHTKLMSLTSPCCSDTLQLLGESGACAYKQAMLLCCHVTSYYKFNLQISLQYVLLTYIHLE